MKWTAPASCPSCGHTERVDLDEDGNAFLDTEPCVVCGKELCAECPQRYVPGYGTVCLECRARVVDSVDGLVEITPDREVAA